MRRTGCGLQPISARCHRSLDRTPVTKLQLTERRRIARRLPFDDWAEPPVTAGSSRARCCRNLPDRAQHQQLHGARCCPELACVQHRQLLAVRRSKQRSGRPRVRDRIAIGTPPWPVAALHHERGFAGHSNAATSTCASEQDCKCESRKVVHVLIQAIQMPQDAASQLHLRG